MAIEEKKKEKSKKAGLGTYKKSGSSHCTICGPCPLKILTTYIHQVREVDAQVVRMVLNMHFSLHQKKKGKKKKKKAERERETEKKRRRR